LSVNRQNDVKFNVDAWTRPENPGLYITYTYAKLSNALRQAGVIGRLSASDMTDSDMAVYAHAVYGEYYFNQSIVNMDRSLKPTEIYERQKCSKSPV
jgi:arginyl-tRNA synthetase